MEKEKIDIDSWYTPKEKKNVTVLSLTDEEELVAEDSELEEEICEMCMKEDCVCDRDYREAKDLELTF